MLLQILFFSIPNSFIAETTPSSQNTIKQPILVKEAIARLMTEAIEIQQAVLNKLQQLPLEKQQEVLAFVNSLRPPSNSHSSDLPSLQKIAALPLAERRRLLQPHISAIAKDFCTDLALTEFSILDGEDWELDND